MHLLYLVKCPDHMLRFVNSAGPSMMYRIYQQGTGMSETDTDTKRDQHEEHVAYSSKVYSHSPIFYWWPVWTFGLLFWFMQTTGIYDSDQAQQNIGFVYAFILLFIIFSTTVRLRGANSVIFGLIVVIGVILIVTAGMTGVVASFFSSFDVKMSSGFYLFVSVAVFLLWLMMFGVFDRLKHWQAVPGQLHEKRFFGAGDIAQGGLNVSSKYQADDFLRHRILGLGVMGDLILTYPDGHQEEVPNVVFAKQRNDEINRVIVIRTSVDI